MKPGEARGSKEGSTWLRDDAAIATRSTTMPADTAGGVRACSQTAMMRLGPSDTSTESGLDFDLLFLSKAFPGGRAACCGGAEWPASP